MFFLPDGNYNVANEEVILETEKNLDFDKSILRDNTRLPQGFVEKMVEKSSISVKRVFIETSESMTDVISLLNKAKDKKRKEIENTPVVNGFKLLKDPEPIPGKIDPVPIMVWGEIASTPQLLKSEKRFIVPSTPSREFLAHNLSTINQAKKMKEVNNTKLKKSQQTFVKSNLNTYELTPGAMKLLSSVRRNHSNIFETPSRKSIDTTFLNKKTINNTP